MLDPRQIRAALELISWNMGDLAEATELSPDTVPQDLPRHDRSAA